MPWRHIRIGRFGGPETLELAEEATVPEPGPNEVRIRVLAAGTGFTDTFIRRGRYPDFKGPLPFTPGYDLVGVVEQTGRDVSVPRVGQMVADLCVTGGYSQYAIRPARFLVQVPEGIDPAEAVCVPLAYLTAYQMLTRYRSLPRGATILVIGASGTVGTALLDLARYLRLRAIGTCSAANIPVVERFGATAIDYHKDDFVAPCVSLPKGSRRSLEWMPCSIRSGAPISPAPSLAWHPTACSSVTGLKTWRSDAKVFFPRGSALRGSNYGARWVACFSAVAAQSST